MSAPTNPPSNEVSPVKEPRAGLLRRLLPSGLAGWLWPILCLALLAALIVTVVLGLPVRPTEKKETAAQGTERELPERRNEEGPPEPLPERLPEPTKVAPTIEMAAADDKLREAAFELALAAYRPLLETAASPIREGLHYRIGLCLEGLGRWNDALVEYRKIGSSTAAPHTAALGQLAQARVYLRLRQPLEAKALLYALVLRSNQVGLRDQPLLADVSYLLGLALALQTTRPPPPGPLHDSVVAHTGTDSPVERAFGFVVAREEPREERPATEHVLVERVGASPETYTVRASVHARGIADFLQRLAEQAGTGLDLSEPARRRLEDRTCTVDVHHLPLADVLRALAEPLGLTVGRREVLLTLRTEEELGDVPLAAYRQAAARHVLRDAFFTYPDDPLRPPTHPAPHPLRPAAYLEAGNLATASGDLTEALNLYQRLTADHSRSPVAFEGYFNLGVIQRRLKNLPAARGAFYQVVDRGLGHELTALAYLRLGRLHLEMAEPENALLPIRRALAGSAGSPTEPAAALALAATQLLLRKPHEAAAVIWDYRHLLADEPYHRTASFLAALGRLRAVADPQQVQREAGDVVAALLILHDPSPVAPVGELLIGHAYRDLGMNDRMAAVYEKALPQVPGALGAEMAYAVAQVRLAENKRARARQWLTPLAQGQYGRWTPPARLRLAELALEEDEPNECLDWCWRHLRDPAVTERADVLRLMGRAYDKLGAFRQAARCYAGEVPTP